MHRVVSIFFLFYSSLWKSTLTPLEPQSRFGDKLLENEVVCLQNGTTVLNGSTVIDVELFHDTSTYATLFRSIRIVHSYYLEITLSTFRDKAVYNSGNQQTRGIGPILLPAEIITP